MTTSTFTFPLLVLNFNFATWKSRWVGNPAVRTRAHECAHVYAKKTSK